MEFSESYVFKVDMSYSILIQIILKKINYLLY